MNQSSNFEHFLIKCLETKEIRINWVELLFYEYYNNVSKETLLRLKENEKFKALPSKLSYHLFKQLSATIDNSKTYNRNVLSLRSFLTCRIGAKLIQFISDLDLTNVAYESEVVNLLIKAFPTEQWEQDLSVSRLAKFSRIDVINIYKEINAKKRIIQKFVQPFRGIKPGNVENSIGTDKAAEKRDDFSYREYMSEDFIRFNDGYMYSSSELAEKIIKIFSKFVSAEKDYLLRHVDHNSITMCCMNFAFDSLVRLNQRQIFNENDQSVIIRRIMLLLVSCINNIIKCVDKPVELIYTKILRVLEASRDIEITCGLTICLINVFGIISTERSAQMKAAFKKFTDNIDLVHNQIEFISSDDELLSCVHLHLTKIIKSIKEHQQNFEKKRKSLAYKKSMNHHHSQLFHCIFERLVINSIVHIKKYKQLIHVLKYLRFKGICCCNANIETIKIFLKSSTIPSVYLKFIEKRIFRLIFNKTKLCIHCNIGISNAFIQEYFDIVKKEIKRRDGYELYNLFCHLIIIHKLMPKDINKDFILEVVMPTFVSEKLKFERNVDEHQESKVICCYTLQILCESSKDNSVLNDILTSEMLNHLRDCTLVPVMSINSCIILRNGLEYLITKDENVEDIQKIKTILFSNIHYLISELVDLYDQIGLPKISFHNESNEQLAKGDVCGFEILDEHIVMIKENLSNLDVLFLSSVHWNILCDLIVHHYSFKSEFVANICNNFNEDILFSISYHAINTILLRRNISRNESAEKKVERINDENNNQEFYTRCDYLTPIIINKYDINYDSIISRSYKLFEICQNFIDKLQSENCEDENSLCMIFNVLRDKNVVFKTAAIHRDNFLSENFYDGAHNNLDIKNEKDSFYTYQHWLHQFKSSIEVFESIHFKDAITKFVNRFIHPEDELRAIYRLNTINELTGTLGIKYLSSVAKNCFEICFRLSENSKLCARMSTAIEELKLLLLQDEWINHKEALYDALQLLISVAEMKVKCVNQVLLANVEPIPIIESIFHDDLNISNEKVIFCDSEDDASEEDKRTETYFTADENYDADEEYFSTFTDEFECSQGSHQAFSFNTIANFSNTNEHICKLVIEVLMDLSRRYVMNKNQWDPELLTSLMKRLSCLNKHFGGSEFLIKGFSPILSEKGEEIEALQKAILDLVGDFNTPEILKEFFAILTSNTAPVELIVARMETLCNQESIPKPFSAVEYPICVDSVDPVIISSCDNVLHRMIQSFRETHVGHKLLTPFTEASQIIPLNVFELKLWNSPGYSLSTWIELQIPTNNDNSAIHLLSFGTDKLLLAIFINSDGSFDFNVMRPNQNYGHNKKSKLSRPDNRSNADTSKDPDQSNKENNLNKSNIFGIASAILKDSEMPNIRTRGSVKNGFKKSLSKDEDRRMETTKVNVKSKKLKLAYDCWSHVCLSIRNTDSQITILLTLNGITHENIEIPIDGMITADVNGKLQLLFVGSQISSMEDYVTSLRYSMSNVVLFQIPLETHIVAILTGLGPDCKNFIECELMKIMPLRGFLDLSKLLSKTSLNSGAHDLMNKLQSNMLMSFVPGKSSYATIFVKSEYGRISGLSTIGKIPKLDEVGSLARSVYYSGGLSTLLFLFARTVELTTDPQTQSSALYIFLKVAYSNNYLYAEFEQKNLFNLVAHVFKHGNCYRGPAMLKAILDVIYGGTMFHKKTKSDAFKINERSELNIRNPSLLVKLLSNFNIFQTTDFTEALNLDYFFKSIMVTVRDSHPYSNINRQALNDHGFYEKLIKFCKIYLADTSSAMKIDPSTALILVELLKMLSKSPATSWSITEIQKVLLLLHHPSESFVTHDRSKFNFILSGQKPSKQSRINQAATSSKYFNFSTKIRSTTAANTSTSPQSPSTSQRSVGTVEGMRSPRQFNAAEIATVYSDSELWRLTKASSIVSNKRKFKARKFDELDESQIHKITKAFTTDKNELITPKKNPTKRLQSTPKKNPFIKSSSTGNIQKRSDDGVIDSKLIDLFQSQMSMSILNISDINKSRYEKGISVLQEHLFVMLKDAVTCLDDLRIQTELSQYFKIEALIMFANHQDPNVRAAIISLISIITKRQETDVIASYQKLNYWIHLGNQLSIWPVNINMVQACIDWICGENERILLTKISKNDEIEIKYKPAFRILIAMLPSMTSDVHLLKYTIIFLRNIIESSHENFQNLTENGLVVALIKALSKIDDKSHSESVCSILKKVAIKSFNTMGSIQILWELLYGLTYAERNDKSEIVREVHIKILAELISSCLEEQNRRGSRAGDIKSLFVIKKKLGNLATSEIKTRFNLVHDRSIQFILSWEIINNLKSFEIDFVKYLIDLHFCGIQQGSSLVLWSLNPACSDEIKLFTAHKLISNLIIDSNFSISDAKIFKSLLYELMNKNATSFSEDQLKILTKYCGTTINQQQQNWNWGMNAKEKIENIRQNAMKEQFQQVDKIVHKTETLVQSCIDHAMRMTRDVINIQNKERRQLMNQLKKTQEIDFYHEWYELIQRMTHESAPWYCEDLYPTTFELNETEGPSRMRVRLKRAVLKIEERFFNNEFKYKAQYQNKKQLLKYLIHPEETETYSIREQVIFNFNAKHLTMEQEIAGEIIVTDTQLIFLTNQNTYTNSIICNIFDIEEICERRYQHKEVALEFFLNTKNNFFIIFESNYDRDIVNKFLNDKIDRKENTKFEVVTQKWIEHKLSNFEYLTELNKISGRSYNDLMQYPIFPWILANFEGEFLDLTIAETYRKFHKTISTQFEETEDHYKMNYEYLATQMNDPQSIMKPYHYSSHYSNSGTVLHFLVRLPPFTNMFLLYQDHNFDIPDRTFHSLATTFRLTSRESMTDVKELIPEFFFLPDFLENQEGFNYGKRQSGEHVNDVKLPEWCDCSSRIFILIHRQALESDFVRKNLHHWIDLVFGFKQKGKAAIDAINVFHPATYPEFQTTSINDAVERSAYETMVRTYGQMPKQIFQSPHKKASSALNDRNQEIRSVLRNVRGLKWGIYTGSPQLPKPRKLNIKTHIPCKQKNSKLVLVKDLNMYFLIPKSASIMQSNEPNGLDLVLWKEKDEIVRTKSLKGEIKKSMKLFSIHDDPVCCGTDVNYSHIWLGHKSGKISVYMRIDKKVLVKKPEKKEKKSQSLLEDIIDINFPGPSTVPMSKFNQIEIISKWMYPIFLLRHQGEVTSIKICTDFKISVSIGIDGRAVIWDSQKIEYIRTIEPPCNTLKTQLSHVDISSTLGDILTVFKPANDICEIDESDNECFEMTENNGDDFINISMSIGGKSQLRLHNINGKYIAHIFEEGIVTSTCFSFIKEGSGVNVIAAAFNDGSIKMFSTWNLELVRSIETTCTDMIKDISFSTNHYLVILTDHEIHLWGTDGLPSERPNFHDIVLVNH